VIVTIGINLREPDSGFTGTGNKCPAGTECSVNSGFYSYCAPGTYAPDAGTQSCYPCPQGKATLSYSVLIIILSTLSMTLMY